MKVWVEVGIASPMLASQYGRKFLPLKTPPPSFGFSFGGTTGIS